MNIHHLELFYYVARHAGISEAVRNMPYGIQQPAVSAQILQLESHLGVSLFQRRPFCLTPAGDKLYRFIQPFFQNLDNISEEIRVGAVEQVRIGASDIILRDHLPEIIQRLRHQFPTTRLMLRSGYQPELVNWIIKREIDVALTLIDKSAPVGFQVLPIIRLPLVLVVSRKRKIKNLADLWKQKRISEPLLCLPPNQLICRNFQAALRALGVDWKPTMELNSLELIQAYVENDYGFGLGIELPGTKFSRKLTVFQLDDFPPVDFGLLWSGNPTPFVKALIQEAQRRAHMFRDNAQPAPPTNRTATSPIETTPATPSRPSRARRLTGNGGPGI